MRILVIGGNGFVGRHLIPALQAHGDDVIAAGQAQEKGRHIPIDLRDFESIRAAVADARPDLVFHLAARTFVPETVASPLETYDANTMGTARVIEAVRLSGGHTKIIFTSTAEVYGMRPEMDKPQREDLHLRPITPYGASKAAAEAILVASARTYGIDVVIARCFNMIGPGQDSRFVVPSFARQLAEIASGAEPVLRVGNLNAQRDFLDVHDAAEAFVMLAKYGEAGEAYNVCSGRAVPIADILSMLVDISGVHVEVRQDPARMRPSDNPLSVGDPAKIQAKTGWKPMHPLKGTLREIYEDAKRRFAPSR